MKRTLLAFGDSHTAGSELEKKYSDPSYELAYPSYIAKHYDFDYENFSVSGGSNPWIWKEFNRVVPERVLRGEQLFVLCNFSEIARMFFEYENKIYHLVMMDLDQIIDGKISRFHSPELLLRKYVKYLKLNSNEKLTEKTFLIIKKIQNYCKQNNIPFVFHTSICWFPGNWEGIDKHNFFGHNHFPEITEYNFTTSQYLSEIYSYWSHGIVHPVWKYFKDTSRWSAHYPEPYHKYWSKLLIDFIDTQGLL